MARSCKIKYTQKTHAYHSCKSKVFNNICVYSPQMRVKLKRALKVRVLKYRTGYIGEVIKSYYHLGHAFVANIAFTHKIVLEISWKLPILHCFYRRFANFWKILPSNLDLLGPGHLSWVSSNPLIPLTLTVPTYFLMLVYQGGVLFATPPENHVLM